MAATRFVSMQNHYNLVYREEEREMIPQCLDQGVGVIPWSPLARGMLTGNRTRAGEKLTTRAQTDAFADSLYKPEVDFDVVEAADEVASRARGVHRAGGAGLAAAQARASPPRSWARPSSSTSRTRSPPSSSRSSDDEIARLEERYVPHAVVGHQ